MISMIERTPSGTWLSTSGTLGTLGQYFSNVLAIAKRYRLPAFEPLAATPPGNGMITPGTSATAACSARPLPGPNRRRLRTATSCLHQAGRKTQPPVEHKLSAQDGNPPHLAAKPHNPLLIAISKIGHLAAHVEILFGVEQVEARRRGAGEHVLADPHQGHPLEGRLVIFAEAGDVQLHNRPGPPVGSEIGLGRPRPDVTIEALFAISAQNCARSIADGRRPA